VAQSGLTAAAVLLAGMVGKMVFGRVSDSVRRDRLIMCLSAVVVALYGVFFATADLGVAIVTAVSAGFFSSAIFPVMQALASDTSGGRTGTALGLTTTFQSAAAVIGVLLPGALLPFGVRWAFAFGAIAPAAAMVVASVLLRESRE